MDYMNKEDGSKAGMMSVVFGDVVLGVHGEGFEYLFSYTAGGMESLTVNGREWFTVRRSLPSGGQLPIMTGEADFPSAPLCGWGRICLYK